MKTAFDLVPATGNTEMLHMLVETGWYGVSFAWFKKDPFSIEGILSCNFNEDPRPVQIANTLQNLFEKEPISNTSFTSVTVFYNFSESLLVPGTYYNEANNNDQLNTFFNLASDSIQLNDVTDVQTSIGNADKIYNIYSVPQQIRDVFKNKFPEAKEHHSSGMQIHSIGDARLQCMIFHNTIKIILILRDQLQVIQQFNYKGPEDIVYHLLNTCRLYGADPNEIRLVLSGMIDARSNLYNELYKYFMNIEFETIPDEVFLSTAIREFPSHFFSHLTALAKCVS